MAHLYQLMHTSFPAGYAVVLVMNMLCFLLIRLACIKRKIPLLHFLFLFGLSMGFSVLGLTIGIIVGDSREPAVNSTISASLTFLGAMVVYLFVKKDSNLVSFSTHLNNGLFVVIIVLVAFPTSLLYGGLLGANNRLDMEEYQQSLEINKVNQIKYYEFLLKVNEDSVKAFLDIYRDSLAKHK